MFLAEDRGLNQRDLTAISYSGREKGVCKNQAAWRSLSASPACSGLCTPRPTPTPNPLIPIPCLPCLPASHYRGQKNPRAGPVTPFIPQDATLELLKRSSWRGPASHREVTLAVPTCKPTLRAPSFRPPYICITECLGKVFTLQMFVICQQEWSNTLFSISRSESSVTGNHQ